MKLILCFLLSALCFSSALAADVIVLKDDGTVTKNGVNLNNVWDALLNKQLTNKECADAWKAKMQELAAKSAELDKAKADADTKAEHVLKILKAELKAQEDSGKGPRWEVLDAVIGKADKDAKTIRKQEIQARRDAAQKELDELK